MTARRTDALDDIGQAAADARDLRLKAQLGEDFGGASGDAPMKYASATMEDGDINVSFIYVDPFSTGYQAYSVEGERIGVAPFVANFTAYNYESWTEGSEIVDDLYTYNVNIKGVFDAEGPPPQSTMGVGSMAVGSAGGKILVPMAYNLTNTTGQFQFLTYVPKVLLPDPSYLEVLSYFHVGEMFWPL